MNETWVDISHIIGWGGNLTGIERVEYHIIEHYFGQTSAGFIYWDETKQRFSVASRKFVERAIIHRSSANELSGKIAKPTTKILDRVLSRRGKQATPSGTIVVLAGLWDNPAYISALAELAQGNRLAHVVYDMIPIIHKEFVVDFLPPVFENYMKQILPLCSLILAISRSTAQDTATVLKQRKLHVPPIKTFRLGDDISRAAKYQKPTDAPREFVLSVGTIEARKNHELLYRLQSLLIKRGLNPPAIVIAGRVGWKTEDFINMVSSDSKGINLIGTPTDEEMRWLYENCLFTITPSYYEGWGLPITESLNYGKVTLASNTSSMTEAGGKNADYFSPDSVDQAADLVVKYLDGKTRKAREAYIKSHYKPVSWSQSAAEFAKLVSAID